MIREHPVLFRISTLAPREGSDTISAAPASNRFIFLPSLPARGATLTFSSFSRSSQNFYPRSPRGERPRGLQCQKRGHLISTLAPREGSDKACAAELEGDQNFYPRSPRGERPIILIFFRSWPTFLPSLPARGATSVFPQNFFMVRISTLAPREGSDYSPRFGWWTRAHFYPRSPRGERRRKFRDKTVDETISTLAPREGSDPPVAKSQTVKERFLPSLPARGATAARCTIRQAGEISTLAPREGSD